MKSLLDDLYINMTVRPASARTLLSEDISFLLSNRIPRQLANRFFGWFSSDRGAVAGASLDGDLAAVRRSRPERIANAALHELARLLHTSAETRRASRRPRPAYFNQPL